MISFYQCKLARAALGWSAAELARRSQIGIATVNRFEALQGEPIPATIAAMQRAFESAGVIFVENRDGPGEIRMRRLQKGDLVRLRPQSRLLPGLEDQVGTVVEVEPHPPQTGPTYRASVEFPGGKRLPGVFAFEFELVEASDTTKSTLEEEIERFAAKLERAGERVFESASIWSTEPKAGAADPKVVAVLLLIRTLSNFRGTIILLRSDRIVEARTVARCCFENLFTIAALREDGQRFILEMGEDHKANRKARAEFLMQQTGEMADTEWQPKLRAFIASLGKGQTKRKSLDPKRVAARGPLLKGYVYYGELSADAAHPTLDALQRYLGHSQENGKPIRTIDINPLVSPRERRLTLLMVCEALLGACVGVMEILNLQPIINDELAALMQEYQALGFSGTLLSKKPERGSVAEPEGLPHDRG
jgi:transcriptional regulator with XRE-family HTH domain